LLRALAIPGSLRQGVGSGEEYEECHQKQCLGAASMGEGIVFHDRFFIMGTNIRKYF
jgi:hypothetical protein